MKPDQSLGKALALAAVFVVVLAILGGCANSPSKKSSRQIDPKPHLITVQTAVDGFLAKNGVLPILNSDLQTPLYEKYKLDFTRLKQHGFLAEIPPNAFENGGSYYYVLVDVETKPTVKLLDMATVRQVRDVERQVKDYMGKYSELPSLAAVWPSWFTIDYAKLKMDDVQVKSPYSQQYLGLLLHESGTVVIDFAIELMPLIQPLISEQPGMADLSDQVDEQDHAESPAQPDQTDLSELPAELATTDLRTLLTAHYHFVPVPSSAYYWIDGEPVLSPRLQQ